MLFRAISQVVAYRLHATRPAETNCLASHQPRFPALSTELNGPSRKATFKNTYQALQSRNCIQGVIDTPVAAMWTWRLQVNVLQILLRVDIISYRRQQLLQFLPDPSSSCPSRFMHTTHRITPRILPISHIITRSNAHMLNAELIPSRL